MTFKPNTGDMRESPSLDIVLGLQKAGATVRAFDPVGMEEAKKLLPGVVWCADAYEGLQDADAVVIITEWNESRSLDVERAKGILKSGRAWRGDRVCQYGYIPVVTGTINKNNRRDTKVTRLTSQ